MNGADLLVKCLEKEEVDVVFGYPGVAICPFYNSILSSEVIAYEDLGTEAIRKLEVKDFPVAVVVDSKGNNLYETAVSAYAK